MPSPPLRLMAAETGPLRVEVLRSLKTVERYRTEINALNLASRRPCPFSTFEYLQTFLAHDESGAKDEELLFLALFHGPHLRGYLALRRHRDRSLKLPFTRIDVMISHDTDRPHLVCRTVDEESCARAVYRHLLEHEKGWSFVELGMQDAASGLYALPSVSPLRYYARHFENMPNSTLPLTFASLREYCDSLHTGQRKGVARYARRLFAAGQVEYVACCDPAGRAAMLELYLDLERRSWKEAAHAGIRRNPRRIEFFRALNAPTSPLELTYEFLLLDGVPVSGTVSGTFCGGLYGLEMAFDRAYEDLAPGHLTTLLTVRRAIEARSHSYNFDGNYAYYKARIGAQVTPTSAVQIFRVGSLAWLKASLGALRRRLKARRADAQTFNAARREVSAPLESDTGPAAGSPGRASRVEERERAQAALHALEAAHVRVERLAGEALARELPFSTKRGTA